MSHFNTYKEIIVGNLFSCADVVSRLPLYAAA